jgi:hypothetical protein
MTKLLQRTFSPHFQHALGLVEGMDNDDTALLPVVPTRPMVVAGARAGHVRLAVARQVYQAMARSGGA